MSVKSPIQPQSERDRLRYLAQRAEFIERARLWKLENKERSKEMDRARYHAKQEQFKENARLWYRDNPERVAAIGRRKRARRVGPGGDFSSGEWAILKDEFGRVCAYCGEMPVCLTQDHIVPLSRGGAHVYENIVPACRSCNTRKNAMDVDLFFEVLVAPQTPPGNIRKIPR